ncbi:hypothetical protein [Streptomyces griseochromogenes]|uniref:hypothetical protein n=1 Tax=Streptomyces griseochromogenes TaxID=68214 RepID=UPI00378D229F
MVIVAVPALVLVWLGVEVVTFAISFSEMGSPQKAPCAEALAFGGAKLPKEAHAAHCTVETWLDTSYDASFRMPREGVRDWLRAAYPHAPETDTEYCDDGVDLCLRLNGEGEHAPPAGAEADAVLVDVTYEGPDRALVRFMAFTV